MTFPPSVAFPRAVLCAGAIVLGATTATGQVATDSARRAVATQVLTLTRASESVVQLMETTIPSQRASLPQVPAEFWDSLLVRARASADSLTRMLAPVFADAFTLDELRQLVAFYESPIGRRLVAQQPGIMARSAEIGQQWGMQLGLEVGEQLSRAGRMRPPEPR